MKRSQLEKAALLANARAEIQQLKVELRWVVQTRFHAASPEWENVWLVSGDDFDKSDEPLTFATQEEAQEELAEHVAAMRAAGMTFDMADYRITQEQFPVGGAS